MSESARVTAGGPNGTPASINLVRVLLQYGLLIVVDAVALLLIYLLAGDGVWELAIFIALVTLLINYLNLKTGLEPLRWITPALTLMLLLVVYPIVYTVFVSTTNYGDGHLLTHTQAVKRFERERYYTDAGNFSGVLFKNPDNEYAVYLINADGEVFFAKPGEELEPIPDADAEADPPESYGDYTQVSGADRFRALQAIEGVFFGPPGNDILFRSQRVAVSQPKYEYDEELDALIDLETRIVNEETNEIEYFGDVYYSNYEIGEFINTAAYEEALEENANVPITNFAPRPTITGFRVSVGLDNFVRFLTSPAINGVLFRIFLWTIAFALLSTGTTFILGLFIALILQTDIPAKKFFRTLLIVPYAIPALIAVATWKGMLDPILGILPTMINSILGPGTSPGFFTDPLWSKIGILIVNLWLGYPYYMLVCSGALAAIPADMYEAARVDGATNWEQFRHLTLPMLLVAVGPLMVASFTFNFNNFVIIEVYNKGGPAIFGATTPAGHTDILISYAFRLAFGTGRGADYGLASAITIIIFIMVAAVTLLQFRFTRQLEEVSENV